MTVSSDARLAFATLLTAALTDTEVFAFPPAKSQPEVECVYVTATESLFEWRSIGSASKNRTEDLTLSFTVETYAEDDDHETAAATATARCEELLAAIETAVVEDAAGRFTVGGTLTQARVSGWTVTPTPRTEGWACVGQGTLTGKNYP